MKRYIILLLVLLATTASATDLRSWRNRSSGGKQCAQVNISGTMTDVLCLDAATNGGGTLGPTAATNDAAAKHVINGSFTAGNVSSTDDSGFFGIGNNIRFNAGTATNNRTNTSTGGAGIVFSNRTSDTTSAIRFFTNLAADSTSTNATNVGTITALGEVILGPSGAVTGARFNNIMYLGGNAAADAFFIVKTTTALTNGQAGFVGFTDVSNNVAQVGAAKNTGLTTTGYMMLKEQDGGVPYLYFADNDNLLFTATFSQIGSGTGTVIGSQSSDIRLKSNIKDLGYGLDTVMLLRPREFAYKKAPGKREIGFIAQETNKVVPEVVYDTGDGENGDKHVLGMKYVNLVPVLTKAIQELKHENDQLKARLDALEAWQRGL